MLAKSKLLCLITIIVMVANSFQTKMAQSKKQRIKDGYEAEYDELAQYVVSIRLDNVHKCGGSIVKLRVILTAAFCLLDNNGILLPARKFTIVAGQVFLERKEPSSQTRKVIDYKINPHFNASQNLSSVGNIALLYLEDDLKKIEARVEQIELPTISTRSGWTCTVLGWGIEEQGEALAKRLQYGDLTVLSYEDCQNLTHINLEDRICVYDIVKEQQTACPGDLGGPFICQNRIQYGIVTNDSTNCNNDTNINVLTNVYFYVDWIKKESAVVSIFDRNVFAILAASVLNLILR